MQCWGTYKQTKQTWIGEGRVGLGGMESMFAAWGELTKSKEQQESGLTLKPPLACRLSLRHMEHQRTGPCARQYSVHLLLVGHAALHCLVSVKHG